MPMPDMVCSTFPRSSLREIGYSRWLRAIFSSQIDVPVRCTSAPRRLLPLLLPSSRSPPSIALSPLSRESTPSDPTSTSPLVPRRTVCTPPAGHSPLLSSWEAQRSDDWDGQWRVHHISNVSISPASESPLLSVPNFLPHLITADSPRLTYPSPRPTPTHTLLAAQQARATSLTTT